MKLTYLKKGCLFLVLLIIAITATAQNVGINTDGSIPNTNAMLDIKSENKGLLIPRMDSNARRAIPNTIGLLVYDSSTRSFWYNDGSIWQNLAVGAGWTLAGNIGNDNTKFLGTIDSVDLLIKVNNAASGFISPGSVNTFWGYKAGITSNATAGNTAMGYNALRFTTTGTANTATGYNVLRNNRSGSENTATGVEALYDDTSGSYNVAVGNSALHFNTNGSNNTAVGWFALFLNTTAGENTAVGRQALYSNTIGANNTAIGSGALISNTTGFNNTSTGWQALFSNTSGSSNNATGALALSDNTTGTGNNAFGNQSLRSNTTGSGNIALGYNSLPSNTTGGSNVAIGTNALFLTSIGSNNTAVGDFALGNSLGGSNNTAIGSGANVPSGATLNNATAIGAGATVNASDKVRIGNASVTVIEGQVPFTVVSDGRFKYNIEEDVKGLDFILKLRPVTYQFDVQGFDALLHGTKRRNDDTRPEQVKQVSFNEAAEIRRTGFIAQEVEKAAMQAGYDFSGIIKPKNEKEHYSLSYESFVVPLVKAVQEQQQIIDTQNKRIEMQDKKLDALQQQVDQLLKLVQAHNKSIK